MPDYETRIKNRRKRNRRLWGSPEWKEAVKIFLELNPFCQWCGDPATTPHHPTNEFYGKPEYLDFTRCKCIPLCTSCHKAHNKGMHICPVCKDRYTYYERCWNCLPEEVKLSILTVKERVKRRKREMERANYQRFKEWQRRKAKDRGGAA